MHAACYNRIQRILIGYAVCVSVIMHVLHNAFRKPVLPPGVEINNQHPSVKVGNVGENPSRSTACGNPQANVGRAKSRTAAIGAPPMSTLHKRRGGPD